MYVASIAFLLRLVCYSQATRVYMSTLGSNPVHPVHAQIHQDTVLAKFLEIEEFKPQEIAWYPKKCRRVGQTWISPQYTSKAICVRAGRRGYKISVTHCETDEIINKETRNCEKLLGGGLPICFIENRPCPGGFIGTLAHPNKEYYKSYLVCLPYGGIFVAECKPEEHYNQKSKQCEPDYVKQTIVSYSMCKEANIIKCSKPEINAVSLYFKQHLDKSYWNYCEGCYYICATKNPHTFELTVNCNPEIETATYFSSEYIDPCEPGTFISEDIFECDHSKSQVYSDEEIDPTDNVSLPIAPFSKITTDISDEEYPSFETSCEDESIDDEKFQTSFSMESDESEESNLIDSTETEYKYPGYKTIKTSCDDELNPIYLFNSTDPTNTLFERMSDPSITENPLIGTPTIATTAKGNTDTPITDEMPIETLYAEKYSTDITTAKITYPIKLSIETPCENDTNTPKTSLTNTTHGSINDSPLIDDQTTEPPCDDDITTPEIGMTSKTNGGITDSPLIDDQATETPCDDDITTPEISTTRTTDGGITDSPLIDDQA
ncbi:hypothetical protein GWI33_012568, partial [Rhynchophorus ferrugineus]